MMRRLWLLGLSLSLGGCHWILPYRSPDAEDAQDAAGPPMADGRMTDHASPDAVTFLPFDRDLLAHWPLDERSGPSFADATGNGNEGRCTFCPTLGVPGKQGTAAHFDGTQIITAASIG